MDKQDAQVALGGMNLNLGERFLNALKGREPATIMTKTIRAIQAVSLVSAVVWGAAIWWINGLPGADIPRVEWAMSIPHFDKIVHFGMYAGLAGFFWIATALGTRPGGWPWIACSVLAVLFPSILGALDEWRQTNIPGRSASLDDWFADAIGAVAAVAILSAIHFWWSRKGDASKSPGIREGVSLY